MLRLSSPGCRLGRQQARQERERLAAAAAREWRPAAAVVADAAAAQPPCAVALGAQIKRPAVVQVVAAVLKPAAAGAGAAPSPSTWGSWTKASYRLLRGAGPAAAARRTSARVKSCWAAR